MSENLDSMNEAGKRPSFLTVLCILTFIGSGLGIIGGLLGLVGSSALGMFAPQGMMIVQIIGLLAAGLCLFGAVKMWGLYKQGFMMYLAGSILSIVGSVISAVTIGSYMKESMDTISGMDGMSNDTSMQLATSSVETLATAAAWTAVVVAVIINTLFIILYNVNRKHLTK